MQLALMQSLGQPGFSRLTELASVGPFVFLLAKLHKGKCSVGHSKEAKLNGIAMDTDFVSRIGSLSVMRW